MSQIHPIVASGCGLTINGTTWYGAYAWQIKATQERRECTNFSTDSGTIAWLPGLPVIYEATVTAEVIPGVANDGGILEDMVVGGTLSTLVFVIDATKSISAAGATILSRQGPTASRRNTAAVEFSVTLLLTGTVTKDFAGA